MFNVSQDFYCFHIFAAGQGTSEATVNPESLPYDIFLYPVPLTFLCSKKLFQ